MIDKEKLQIQLDELQKLLDSQHTAYDFEKTFDEKWQEITKEVFQSTLCSIPSDKNKKNDSYQIWEDGC